MASVRMTQQLQSDIKRKATEAFKMANPEPKPSAQMIADLKAALRNMPIQVFLRNVHERAVAEGFAEKQFLHSLPTKNTYYEIKVVMPCDENGDDGKRFLFTLDTNIDLIGDNHYRTRDKESDHYSPGNPITTEFALEDQTKITQHVITMYDAQRKFYDVRNDYDISIRKLLQECTTVKQLLDVWPAAESLVPSDKLQAMRVKVTRAQKAQNIKAAVSFDPTAANKTLLTAKLLGGAS